MALKIITAVIAAQAIRQNIIRFVILNDNSAISGIVKEHECVALVAGK